MLDEAAVGVELDEVGIVGARGGREGGEIEAAVELGEAAVLAGSSGCCRPALMSNEWVVPSALSWTSSSPLALLMARK